MRLVALAGMPLVATSLPASADTITNPTINGQAVISCPAINGLIDCQRAMIAATAVCKEYGFRRAGSYHLRQMAIKGVRLVLSINNQEAIDHSEWGLGNLGPSFDEIDCTK
jgi:hypothetical protein